MPAKAVLDLDLSPKKSASALPWKWKSVREGAGEHRWDEGHPEGDETAIFRAYGKPSNMRLAVIRQGIETTLTREAFLNWGDARAYCEEIVLPEDDADFTEPRQNPSRKKR